MFCMLSAPQSLVLTGAASQAVTSTAANAQRQEAAVKRRAEEMDSDMDRLLETASSGGMSTGLEFDLSTDNSTNVIKSMQARGLPD